MKSLIVAAMALTMTGSALAYQTYQTTTTTADDEVVASTTMTVDPYAPIAPPAAWTAEQRGLWDAHMASLPDTWTDEQRAAFQAMMAIPPASWTAEQRALYQAHLSTLPANWTAEQRLMYEQQIASLRTPWTGDVQTASTTTTPQPVVQPDLSTFAGMGGPYEEVYGSGAVSLTPRPADRNYPPCDPGPGDDNCIQLYEPGVRQQLASWNRPTGGLADGQTAMGGPYEPVTDTGASTSTTTTTEPTTADPTGTTEDDTTQPQQPY